MTLFTGKNNFALWKGKAINSLVGGDSLKTFEVDRLIHERSIMDTIEHKGMWQHMKLLAPKYEVYNVERNQCL